MATEKEAFFAVEKVNSEERAAESLSAKEKGELSDTGSTEIDAVIEETKAEKKAEEEAEAKKRAEEQAAREAEEAAAKEAEDASEEAEVEEKSDEE